jgi:Zn-dependent protease with chaperone function
LWRAVREAAQRLGATPPDRIVVGLQMNFYVTELSVRVDEGVAHGRTLFLSYPMLKLLSPEEVLAIIGHELGHFLGEDTRLTREFYPLRFKVNGTVYALAHAGWAGWTSIHGIGFFNWAFGGTEQAMSRERELIADRVAADLTSAATMARALVKFQVMCEAFNLQLAAKESIENPLTTSLAPVIRTQLVPNQQFWRDLFEMKTPHPLDSHPDLRTRLASLGESMDAPKAIAIATAEVGSAYEAWFGGREAVFAEFVTKANTAIGEVQRQGQIRAANYETDEGRRVLEELFPERHFPMRKTTGKVVVALTIVITGVFAWLLRFLGGDAGRIVPFLLVVGGAFCSWRLWRWVRDTEIILRADRIEFSGWNRPLPWADVAHLNAANINGVIRVIFHLKQKASPFARWTFFHVPRQTVQLGVGHYDIKPQDLLQLIHRYHTRQLEPAAP